MGGFDFKAKFAAIAKEVEPAAWFVTEGLLCELMAIGIFPRKSVRPNHYILQHSVKPT